MTYQSHGNYPETIIELTREQAEYCAHPGNCDQEVADIAAEIHDQLVKVDKENLAKELSEYTDWDVSNHEENLLRWVWITANNIVEEIWEKENE